MIFIHIYSPNMVVGQKSKIKKFQHSTPIYKRCKLCRHHTLYHVFIEVRIIGIAKYGTGKIFITM